MVPTLIGISGKLGTGKSFISNKVIVPLIESNVLNSRVFVIGLGDQVKAKCVIEGGFDASYVEEDKKSIMRKRFQKEGMDKRAENADYWVNYVRCWMKMFKEKGYTHFVIEGVRFENEIAYIKENGGKVYRIVAQDRNRKKLEQEALSDPDVAKELQDHVSEKSVDVYGQFDGIVDNDRATAADLMKYFGKELLGPDWEEKTRQKACEIADECVKLIGEILKRDLGQLMWMHASGQLRYRGL